VDVATEAIFWIMFVEHLITYCLHYFRQKEVEMRGVLDVNGVMHAPIESALKSIEVFFDCILCGYVVHYMSSMESEKLHAQAFYSYWILIDVVIIFFAHFFNYICQIRVIKQDLVKNLFTLYYV
jgi:hypothetical protein